MAELIVALDVPAPEAVGPIVEELGGSVEFYKIGLELYCAGGNEVVRAVTSRGKRVFLDLKFHDIPRTVERAVAVAANLGVELMTLHASGGRAMIAAAATAARNHPAATRPRLLAVTMLTSLADDDLHDLGIARSMSDQVLHLASLAVAAGADGIVCSPQEVGRLAAALPPGTLLVTPGIRPATASLGDQKRVATPAAAVAAGATHLVVGRPIVEAANRHQAASAILAEMRA